MTEAEKLFDLSEEDKELSEKLEMLVSRLKDPSHSESALNLLEEEVRGATTSMTSIPKPLKFLRS